MTELANLIQGGAGVTGAFNKESQVGTQASGTITEVSLVQLNDYVTKQPKFWDDGKPQMQIRIVFQADQGTWFPTSEDDTGLRSMHIKTWGMHLRTFREAMQAAGAAEPQVGGHLSIRFDREEPSTQGSPTKVFEYQYRPPASDVSQMLGGQQQPPQHQAQAPQQPYQQPQQQQPQQQAQPQQFQAPQPQQAPAQQQPVAPVAPAQAPMVATPQGQVDLATGELSNFPAPVPAQQPQQQAQQPPQQAQAPQQVQQQAGVDPWTGQTQQPAQPQAQQPASQQVDPNAGMDSQIIKLVRGGIPDNVITQTLGVTAEQVAQIRATLG